MSDEPGRSIDNDRVLYESERARLVQSHVDTNRFLDRSILILASGAIGTSFLLIRDLNATSSGLAMWLIATSWAALACTVGACLMSLVFQSEAEERMRQVLDEEAQKGPQDILRRAFLRYNPEIGGVNRRIKRVNCVARFGFGFGLACLVGAAALSLIFRGGFMQDGVQSSTNSHRVEITKGANAAPPPVNVPSQLPRPGAGGTVSPPPVNVAPPPTPKK